MTTRPRLNLKREGDRPHGVRDHRDRDRRHRLLALLPIYSRVVSSLLLKEGAQASANEEYDRAMAEFTQAIALDPKGLVGYEVRSDVDVAKGNYAQAIADYKQAASIDPKNALMINNLAWTLATCPDASLRDGKKSHRVRQARL